ncbi:hypothetical protein MHU86_20132 [Fragilaria crotonensis]|nr:hypothetical protein MHU86_20132 [Fragilaria crotonensis]
MRVSAELLLLVVGCASAFVAGPQGYVQKNGQTIRRSMATVSAVSAEVNGAQTAATASVPNLNIRLNVNEKLVLSRPFVRQAHCAHHPVTKVSKELHSDPTLITSLTMMATLFC